MPNIKPRYEVHKVPGTATRTYCKPKEEGGFEYEEVEVDAGYMVYFPNGSSIRCWDDAHLASLDFDKPAALVDMDTGDEVGTSHGSLKSRADQINNRGRRSTGSLQPVEEGVS